MWFQASTGKCFAPQSLRASSCRHRSFFVSVHLHILVRGLGLGWFLLFILDEIQFLGIRNQNQIWACSVNKANDLTGSFLLIYLFILLCSIMGLLVSVFSLLPAFLRLVKLRLLVCVPAVAFPSTCPTRPAPSVPLIQHFFTSCSPCSTTAVRYASITMAPKTETFTRGT